MPDWTLHRTADADRSEGLTGYGVLDAVEIRIGQVTGCVLDGEGCPRLLTVGGRGRTAAQYLVPLGYVIRVDTARRRVQLRDLTRQRLAERCLRVETELPPQEVLESLVSEAPPVRPELARALSPPEQKVAKRLPELRRRPSASWQSIGALDGPTWTPLIDPEDVRMVG